MKKGIIKLLSAGLTCLAVVSVQAIPITGSISFDANATLNSALQDATAFTSISGSTVAFGANGSYAGLSGQSVTWNQTFGFSTTLTSVSILPLWTFSVGTVTYSFDATSLVVTRQDSAFLNISGSGVAHIHDSANVLDYADTLGNWTIAVTSGNSLFTFNDTTTTIPTSVPDGATTIVLLGMGLSGLSLIRKKLL